MSCSHLDLSSLLLFHLTYHPRYLLYPSPSYFFFSFFFILSARSVGVSEEAREQRSGERQRTRAALCHPFVFASQRPARRLDYHVSCFVKERGVALRGLSNTVPFFFFPPPLWPVMRKDIQQKRKRFQCTLEPCLCLYNCAYFALRGAPADVRRISTSLH